MSSWALLVFVVVVAGATLWAAPRGGASLRRPRPASRRAGLEVGPPIDTIRLSPRPRRPSEREGDARHGAP